MSSVEVTAISIPELLKRLYSGEWQAPQFQRDFVWSNPQIISLVNSRSVQTTLRTRCSKTLLQPPAV